MVQIIMKQLDQIMMNNITIIKYIIMIVQRVYNSMMKSIKMTHFGIPLSPDHLEQ